MSERDKIRTFPMLIRAGASSEAGRMTPFAFLLMVTNARVYKQVSRAFLKIPHQLKTLVLDVFVKSHAFVQLVPRARACKCSARGDIRVQLPKSHAFVQLVPSKFRRKKLAGRNIMLRPRDKLMQSVTFRITAPLPQLQARDKLMQSVTFQKNAALIPIKARDKLQKIVTFRARTTHRAAQTRINK